MFVYMATYFFPHNSLCKQIKIWVMESLTSPTQMSEY